MAVGDAHAFPGFLTPVLTQLFFPKAPTTFLTCFCRGERRKYTGKKVRKRGENTPGHESDTLTTDPPWWGSCEGRMTPVVKTSSVLGKSICRACGSNQRSAGFKSCTLSTEISRLSNDKGKKPFENIVGKEQCRLPF